MGVQNIFSLRPNKNTASDSIGRAYDRHQRSKNYLATTQNSLAKFCLFPERALPFHHSPSVTLQYSSAIPIS